MYTEMYCPYCIGVYAPYFQTLLLKKPQVYRTLFINHTIYRFAINTVEC
jgi:hypothetical protein